MPIGPGETKQLTAIIRREDEGVVALCPHLAVASQGHTVEEARQDLQEAVELFLETADPTEVDDYTPTETYVTRLAVAAQ